MYWYIQNAFILRPFFCQAYSTDRIKRMTPFSIKLTTLIMKKLLFISGLFILLNSVLFSQVPTGLENCEDNLGGSTVNCGAA